MKTVKWEVSPDIWTWILDATDLSDELAAQAKPWIDHDKTPTLKQLEKFGKKIHVPFAYFLLKRPPREDYSLLEYRTVNSVEIQKMSRNLFDVSCNMTDIQEWMRGYHFDNEDGEKLFVGSIDQDFPICEAAVIVRGHLKIEKTWFKSDRCFDKIQAFKYLRDCMSEIGVVVMTSGIVGNNARRALNVEEFRAFALVDKYAPLIFINGKDSIEGKIFSILHEFVHIVVGANNLHNVEHDVAKFYNPIEIFCNGVAAEILVPVDIFKEKWNENKNELSVKISQLSAYFKCSQTVIARRAFDCHFINSEIYKKLISEAKKLVAILKDKRGGDYYKTAAARIDKYFLLALYNSVKEGKTFLRDACLLSNTNRTSFFELVRTVHGGLDD
ncbi:MAG: ImmA/IrrE family metallo-endopeptidase [Deltaproteobacteria bacterium]|jgi:Zn-dependent peptidase ImmA (M78 family)|nr:ImmA/IrrE family metallo-endopeptidase [Deltaproteobacteria bacterium]